ncbi:hypothetical protein O7606_16265 [Micromonospora sp. WMMD882]|nr:hypothetical protein [Micromonospora sp. WMMD882]WBB77823.1 hypothetical protein O7606_16265 [Micromonospora sp. WMMD882]
MGGRRGGRRYRFDIRNFPHLAPGTGLVDRLRDAFSGRPTTVAELREKQR